MVRNRSGPMISTTWPMARNSSATVARVRTTPLTWGFQASVIIRIRWEGAGGSMPTTPGRLTRGRESGSWGHLAETRLEEGEPVERRPVDQLQAPVMVLHQRGAAFHPVAVVQVKDTLDLAHLGL